MRRRPGLLLSICFTAALACTYTQFSGDYVRFPRDPDYLLVFLSSGHEIVAHDLTADTFEPVVTSEDVIVGHQFSPSGDQIAFFNVSAEGEVPYGSRWVELHVLSLRAPETGDTAVFAFPIDGFKDSPLITDDFVYPVWEGESSLLVAHNRGVTRVRLDGTSEELAREKNIKSLALAPDGSQIVFGYDNHLVTMNPDGTSRFDITEATGLIGELNGIHTRAAAFSPDGSMIAVGSGADLYLVERTPLSARIIFDAKLAIKWLAWWPAGDRLFFVCGREFRTDSYGFPAMYRGRYGMYQLFSIGLAGADPIELFRDNRTDVLESAPSMSPDGGYVAVVRELAGARRVVVVAADGSGVRMPATDFSERYPTWWP